MYIEGWGECKRVYIANIENKRLAKLIMSGDMDDIVNKGNELGMKSVAPFFGYYGFVFYKESDRDEFVESINELYGAICYKHTDDTAYSEDYERVVTDIPSFKN